MIFHYCPSGTVIYVPKKDSSDDHVTVIWDNGRELRYRAGKDGKYDLRVLDNAPIGMLHVYTSERTYLPWPDFSTLTTSLLYV